MEYKIKYSVEGLEVWVRLGLKYSFMFKFLTAKLSYFNRNQIQFILRFLIKFFEKDSLKTNFDKKHNLIYKNSLKYLKRDRNHVY